MKKLLLGMVLIAGVGCQESYNSQMAAGEEGYAVVIGKDNREEVTGTSKKTSPVGRLDMTYKGDDNQSHCTGTLISDDLVLTAGHCTFRQSGEGFPVSITFNADVYSRKTNPEYYLVDRIYTLPAFSKKSDGQSGVITMDDIANDIAVVRLAKLQGQAPAGKKYGTYQVEVAPTNATASLISYPGDKVEESKWIEEGCSYSTYKNGSRLWDIFDFTCDGFVGASGSSLLMKDAHGKNKIGGVFSSESPSLGKNFGAMVTPAIADAVNALIRGESQNIFVEKAIASDIGSEISLLNRCKDEMRVIVRYQDLKGAVVTSKWIRVPAKSQVMLFNKTSSLQFGYYAETVHDNFAWSGDGDVVHVGNEGPFALSTIQMDAPMTYLITLQCK
jgi:V8-like Glu-specific endopeptidase